MKKRFLHWGHRGTWSTMRGRNDRRQARLGGRSRRLVGHELLTLRKQRASRKYGQIISI